MQEFQTTMLCWSLLSLWQKTLRSYRVMPVLFCWLPCCAGVYSSHTYDQTHIRLPCCAVAIDYRVVPESLRMVRLPCCAGALYYRNCVNFSIFINLGPFEMLLFLCYNSQSQFWVDVSSLINKFVSDTDCRATRIRFILKSQSLFTFLQKRG